MPTVRLETPNVKRWVCAHTRWKIQRIRRAQALDHLEGPDELGQQFVSTVACHSFFR